MDVQESGGIFRDPHGRGISPITRVVESVKGVRTIHLCGERNATFKLYRPLVTFLFRHYIEIPRFYIFYIQKLCFF